jgi:hypothetical protein
MPATPTPESRELRQRLQARAHRARILRRRVAALTISLFLASWGTIYGAGHLGASSAKVSLLASVSTDRTTPEKAKTTSSAGDGDPGKVATTSSTTSDSVSSKSDSSSSAGDSSTTGTPTAVTTQQS